MGICVEELSTGGGAEVASGTAQATVFAQEMGTAMADVPVFGTNFNTWFPLVAVVYCSLL